MHQMRTVSFRFAMSNLAVYFFQFVFCVTIFMYYTIHPFKITTISVNFALSLIDEWCRLRNAIFCLYYYLRVDFSQPTSQKHMSILFCEFSISIVFLMCILVCLLLILQWMYQTIKKNVILLGGNFESCVKSEWSWRID